MVGSAFSVSEIAEPLIVLRRVLPRMKAFQRMFNCCVSLEVIDENGPTYYTSSGHVTKRLTASEHDSMRSQETKQTTGLERRKEQALLAMVPPPHATKGD